MRPVGGPASAEKGGRKAVGFAGQSWCFPGQHVTPPGVPAEVPFPAGWTPPPSTPKCRILGPDRARETVQPDPKKGVTGEAGQGPKTGRAGGPKLYPAHPPRRQSCRANPQFDDHLNAPSGWHGSRGDLGAENGAPHRILPSVTQPSHPPGPWGWTGPDRAGWTLPKAWLPLIDHPAFDRSNWAQSRTSFHSLSPLLPTSAPNRPFPPVG